MMHTSIFGIIKLGRPSQSGGRLCNKVSYCALALIQFTHFQKRAKHHAYNSPIKHSYHGPDRATIGTIRAIKYERVCALMFFQFYQFMLSWPYQGQNQKKKHKKWGGGYTWIIVLILT